MTRPKEFVTITEAARRVGITEIALRRRIRRGELRAYQDPRDLRAKLVRVDELDAYFSLPHRPVAVGVEGMRYE